MSICIVWFLGAHLPVAPPIPPEILKSLEWNAAHPEEDDGNTRPGAGYRGWLLE